MTATRTPGGDPRLVRRYLAAQGRRPPRVRLSDAEDDEDADEGEGQDHRELAELMAEVLYGVLGDDVLEALGGDEDADEDDDSGDVQLSATARKNRAKWDPLAHPRGPGGRFIPKGSAEAHTAAIAKVKALKGKPATRENVDELAGHLAILKRDHLRAIARAHGLKPSGKLREHLVQILMERLPGPKPEVVEKESGEKHVRIESGGKSADYAVKPMEPGKGEQTALRLENQTSGEVYDVVRKDDGTVTCTCPGFKHRGKCKHVGAIKDLAEKGALPEPEKAAAEQHVAEQEAKATPVEAKKDVRFEAGKKLTREERSEVLRSVKDAYKEVGLEKSELKGYDRNDDPIYGYPYSPEHFVRSDITGAPLRHYVTLPDGRKAHPTELFPNITNADVARAIGENEAQVKAAEARDRSRAERHAADKGGANLKYNQTNRPLAHSYLVKGPDGQFARVDGTDAEDVSYFSSHGYEKVSNAVPASMDLEQGDRAKKAIESALAAGRPVPEEVLADYPDLAAKHGKGAAPDKLPGGKADDIPLEDFPPDKVAQGAAVEREHTSDPEVAKEIARDHLAEGGEGYYDRLKAVEGEKPGEVPLEEAKGKRFNPKGTLVARSNPRDRMEVDEGQRWNEYRVRKVSADEWDDMRRAGTVGVFDATPGWIMEQRRITTGPGGEEGKWEFWGSGNKPQDVIESMTGDSAYEEAESLHPHHAAAVSHSRDIRKAASDAWDAKKAHEAAVEAVQQYKFESNREFGKKTRDVTDEKKIEAIRQRMMKSRGPRMQELQARATEAERAREEAEKRHEELKKKKPIVSEQGAAPIPLEESPPAVQPGFEHLADPDVQQAKANLDQATSNVLRARQTPGTDDDDAADAAADIAEDAYTRAVDAAKARAADIPLEGPSEPEAATVPLEGEESSTTPVDNTASSGTIPLEAATEPAGAKGEKTMDMPNSEREGRAVKARQLLAEAETTSNPDAVEDAWRDLTSYTKLSDLQRQELADDLGVAEEELGRHFKKALAGAKARAAAARAAQRVQELYARPKDFGLTKRDLPKTPPPGAMLTTPDVQQARGGGFPGNKKGDVVMVHGQPHVVLAASAVSQIRDPEHGILGRRQHILTRPATDSEAEATRAEEARKRWHTRSFPFDDYNAGGYQSDAQRAEAEEWLRRYKEDPVAAYRADKLFGGAR